MTLTLFTRLKILAIGAIVSFSSIFQMGYSNAYVNTAVQSFKDFFNESLTERDFNVTEDTYTWVWSSFLNSWFPGFALGAWLAVPLTDSLGRKAGLLCGNGLIVISVFLMTVAVSFMVIEMLMLGRFFSATGSGISMCALVLFLQEISPNEMRGTLGFFAETSFVAMNAVGAVLGMSMLLGDHLKALVGLALFPAIISFVVVIPLKETPKFLLLKKNKANEAISAIQFYHGADDHHANKILDEIGQEDSSEQGSFLFVLKTPSLRKGLLLGVLALQITTSIWPVIFLSTDFLIKASISSEVAEYVSSVMLVLSTGFTVIGMASIEKFSRKKCFLWASTVNVSALALFVLCSQLQKVFNPIKYGCVLAICLHGTSYSFATGPIAWFLVTELVPTNVRSLCSSVALALNHISAVIVTFLVLPLYNKIDSLALLILFVIPSALSILYLVLYLPETKGRLIADIVNDLVGDKDQEELKLKNKDQIYSKTEDSEDIPQQGS